MRYISLDALHVENPAGLGVLLDSCFPTSIGFLQSPPDGGGVHYIPPNIENIDKMDLVHAGLNPNWYNADTSPFINQIQCQP